MQRIIRRALGTLPSTDSTDTLHSNTFHLTFQSMSAQQLERTLNTFGLCFAMQVTSFSLSKQLIWK